MRNEDLRISIEEYLATLPADVLFRLVPEKAGRRVISAAAVRNIAGELNAPEYTARRLASLSDEAAVLVLSCWLAGHNGVPADNVTQDLRAEALESMLIYMAENRDGKQTLFAFKDSIRLASLLAKNGRVIEHSPAPQTHSHLSTAPVSDLVLFLGSLLCDPLPLSRSGELPRAAVMNLRKAMHLRHCPVVCGDYRDARVVVNFLLDFSKHALLVSCKDGTARCARTVIDDLLLNDPADILDNMRKFAASHAGVPDCETVVALVNESDDALLLHRSLYGLKNGNFDQGMFLLSWLGLITAETVDERIAVSKPGDDSFTYSESSSVTIVADFSAIVPQEARPEAIARFLRIGRLSTLDRVYKGEITKELITSSLAAGFRGDDLLTILEIFHAPTNVASSVREWIREFSRASILDSSTLVVCDERTAASILARPQIVELVEDIPCVKLFRIREGQRAELESRLVAMGFDPRFPVLTDAKPEEDIDINSVVPERFKVVSDFLAKQSTTVAVGAGKYSPELKTLEHADLMHVINYSILMGHKLKLEVEAFTGTKAGIYSVSPERIGRFENADAVICEAEGSKPGRQIPVKKIKKIGVIYE